MIIHWDELRRYGKRLCAWVVFAVVVTPFLILIGAIAFALAASRTEQQLGARASEFVGIAAACIAVIALLQALLWWISR